MIELYQLINGKYDCVCMPDLTGYTQNFRHYMKLEGIGLNIKQMHWRYNLRQLLFYRTDLYLYGIVADGVVAAESVNSFKSSLDKFWCNQDFLYNYKSQPDGTGSRSKVESYNNTS